MQKNHFGEILLKKLLYDTDTFDVNFIFKICDADGDAVEMHLSAHKNILAAGCTQCFMDHLRKLVTF